MAITALIATQTTISTCTQIQNGDMRQTVARSRPSAVTVVTGSPSPAAL
jgi:hypothetical protein